MYKYKQFVLSRELYEDVYANETWPSGLVLIKGPPCAGTLEISEKNVDLGAPLRMASFAAKFIDSSGTVVLPSAPGDLKMRAFLLRVSRECTSLDVSCSAARIMIKVGVMPCRDGSLSEMARADGTLGYRPSAAQWGRR